MFMLCVCVCLNRIHECAQNHFARLFLFSFLFFYKKCICACRRPRRIWIIVLGCVCVCVTNIRNSFFLKKKGHPIKYGFEVNRIVYNQPYPVCKRFNYSKSICYLLIKLASTFALCFICVLLHFQTTWPNLCVYSKQSIYLWNFNF